MIALFLLYLCRQIFDCHVHQGAECFVEDAPGWLIHVFHIFNEGGKLCLPVIPELCKRCEIRC